MTAELSQAGFEPLLNQMFRVRPAGGLPELDLQLVEVSGTKDAVQESFSLLFRGPREGVFPHDTHTLIHPVLGSAGIFMGPVQSAKSDGVYYQAVFSRLVA